MGLEGLRANCKTVPLCCGLGSAMDLPSISIFEGVGSGCFGMLLITAVFKNFRLANCSALTLSWCLTMEDPVDPSKTKLFKIMNTI